MEKEILQKGQEILSATKGESMAIFRRDYWNGKIMEWSMKNHQFKINMFRFVDVLPVLQDNGQIAEHLREYFSHGEEELPSVLKWGLGTMGATGLTARLAAGAIQKNVVQMAKMFITGTTPEEAFPVLEKLRKQDLCFTVDILGEAALSETEAKDYQQRYIALFNELHKLSRQWKDHDLLDFDHNGPIPKVNVSVKLSSLYSQLNVADHEHTLKTLKERLRPIMQVARDTGGFINLDMEQYALKDLTYDVFLSLLEEEAFRAYPHVGVVVQAYLRSAESDLRRIIDWCKKQKRSVTIRLVKGAYWDYEFIHAKQYGWPIPVFTSKAHSDSNYELLTRMLFENWEYTRPALGTHNIRSLAHAFVLADQMKLPKKLLEVQMLYGMAEPIKKAVTRMGYRCRDYAPVGELLPGMAYLVRRLLENTSNESFLRLKFMTDTPLDVLLRTPQSAPRGNGVSKGIPMEGGVTFRAPSEAALSEPFITTPLIDFAEEEPRKKFFTALESVKKQLGKDIPVRIGGDSLKRDPKISSLNPCQPSQAVGVASKATKDDALKALEVAKSAYTRWSKTTPTERAMVLLKAAQFMREHRYEIAAWEVFEVAKSWKEADADVVEAIDFCEYYAREAFAMGKGKALLRVPGEDNTYTYRAKGVGVVISPWNFPLAIPMGMTAASIVTGNPTILKPAGQSVIMGEWVYRALREGGCPADVIHYLPGSGSELGPVLTQSPTTAFIVFTGSMEVGTQIIEEAAKRVPGARLVKKVVAEMGGKNALIVDEDADLDEAVTGCLYSAYGFQGQKCSALSRLIVHEAIYDRFMDRFREAMKDIRLGEATDAGVFLSAVVDKGAFQKISAIIEETRKIAARTTQGAMPTNVSREGYYIPPTLFEGVMPDARAAKEEIFGPVVVAFKVKSLEEGVKLANSGLFALTGGLFSRSPAAIAYVRENLEAGNIYINRGITGAIVHRHPFGGYKLSGVGSKAGGPDYLYQFVDPVTVVENTMRRGFAPEIES